ncbi:hypothetical protein ACJMK2_023519 [Sinanodonta woodiana]|uniref:Uncharacterized protein n=1 Tax=Sinanodonta woodiana TaxID=1069815 RepID=A0ABD3T632_SINWO
MSFKTPCETRMFFNPKDLDNQLLQVEELEVIGIKAKLYRTVPVVQEVEAKLMDVFVSSLPLEIDKKGMVDKIQKKLLQKQGKGPKKVASVWGFKEVKSVVRIMTELNEEAKKISTFI